MATPQVKDLVLRSPAGSSEVVTYTWPLQVGSGQDKHDNGIDIIDTIKFVCDDLPSISSAFEEINLNQIDTACYKTMTNLVDRFNKAVDSIVALEKGTSLPAERLNKFAHPSLLRHILQLVYNAAVLDPEKLNTYVPFSPEVYGETSYELVQQMIKHVNITNEDTFIDLGSGVGQVVLQMAGSFPLKTCIGIEKADTPAAYAERMDAYFRQFMAWFGKRYCEYKLIKGDFLVDEHREKITSSTLVFVNNFAFGPNVDHQLKERFADLRDSARIVSSKSFCPLNFRITDRNLSDIGTIMHVSEIPPLKGSVSWTCKPVSYYLHIIDRTILERYFQRLKIQKGAENDHVGSARTTRDRAKREANNTAYNNSNSNSTVATNNRTNSPANVNNNATASKNKHQQQQQQQQPPQQTHSQRNIDMDTSTESDCEASANGTNVSNGTGPTTRKIWSDWCSSKGKSSQSDDEENNNFSSTTNSRNTRITTQKKRKKLTRKAAIANKTAAAAQREAAARERAEAIAAAAANSKESSSKEDNAGSGGASASNGAKGRKGRMKKGGRGRKSLKIVGLDVLHKQTLLSTSVEKMSKKLPPAPGCVDQQLTSLLTGNMSHTELDIPEAPQNTPYGLQILLDLIRSQYMNTIEQMKNPAFVPQIKQQIMFEKERNERIKSRINQLEKQIKTLIDDSVALLKARLNELGLDVVSSTNLIVKAKEIVNRHKELQNMVKKMQSQVTICEIEQKRLIRMHLQSLPEYQKSFCINGRTKSDLNGHNSVPEISESKAKDVLLKEIWNTLQVRKKLNGQVDCFQQETAALEKIMDDRRTAAALLAQGTNMTLATSVSATHTTQLHLPTVHAASNPNGNNLQPLQLTTNNNNFTVNSAVPNNVNSSKTSSHTKTSRRSRDHRTRSQEWPDVPDVGKIEESNPEVLAQKILETGRQIEAGKFTTAINSRHNNQHHDEKRSYKHSRNNNDVPTAYVGAQDSTLMPAPSAKSQLVLNTNVASPTATNSVRSSSGMLPKCELPGLRKSNTNNIGIQESPKVANFEDRLKSIITSALNEDQEHRKAATHHLPNGMTHMHDATIQPIVQQPPSTSKRSKHSTAVSSANHLPPPSQGSNNLNNILNVAAQGLTHLNATTTISPVTPPHSAGIPPGSSISHHNKFSNKQQTVSSSLAISAQKYSTKDTSASSMKYQHHVPAHQLQQHNMAHMSQQALYPNGSNVIPTDLAYNHRQRNNLNAASLENFHPQQLLMAAAAAAASQHQQHAMSASMHNHILPLEFKAPTTADSFISAAQRSSSRELIDDVVAPRSGSASSDSALMYFPPTRDRLMSHERSVSRESAASQSTQHHQPPRPNSRPNSNSSQPDYTQVSPAKMALRRHLSQEKLNQVLPASAISNGSNNSGMPMSKTIGDLVNTEIERTLEISHQSIIDAAVDMSAVGSVSGIVAPERNHFMERNLFAERERERSNEARLHDRLLINPNAQRPERVHVRLIDEQTSNMHIANNFSNVLDISSRANANANPGRKSPVAHNLATLAHVAYNHKAINANVHDSSTTNTRNNNRNASNATPYQLSTSKRISSTSNDNQITRSSRARDYQPVALPRAEMKGCIEAYFNDEHQQQQQQQQQQQIQQHKSSSVKERNSGRMGRLNNGNPPLEGLAASLQDHVMATRKFKEENEERQRRAAAATNNEVHNHNQQHNAAHHVNNLNVHNSEHHQSYQSTSINNLTQNESSPKLEAGLKRTSPMVNNQPRPPKIPHYSQDSISSTHHIQQNQQQQQQQLKHNNLNNPYANVNGGLHTTPSSSTPSPNSARRTKLPLEPLLMSPEINSIMGDERPLQLSSQRQQNQQPPNTTSIISGRAGADDVSKSGHRTLPICVKKNQKSDIRAGSYKKSRSGSKKKNS
ncbi:histone-lysine N-methyltransferase, H3 lysine-79 specific isoform X2 [Teleopsis dalmanni]|uniref:histone-lysine N-methyltransferase, H3 lysine-79 specific isoform X2 n=1 Tax=Teleopsis dalmanni TaxID=139649 RepID=UPI0018CDC559|nr:histone-lysine N-methyltransferase, H3 lysine-79 specific isoform X2 [Teleopsis dalmanni]